MFILIITKQSKYEFEMDKFRLSHEDIIKKYSKERANLDAILDSHYKQLEVRNDIKKIMHNYDMCSMNNIDKYSNQLQSGKYDMVLSLGGDNLFCYVTHHVGETPLLGINSDPKRSTGCLSRWAIEDKRDIYNLATMIDNRLYKIDNWPRISAEIDGVKIQSATSEYYFGERLRKNMSRHILVYRGKEYEQKSSGILFSTGAGSTGWFNSACPSFVWAPESKQIRFLITEPYNSSIKHGELEDEITLYSLNDDAGYCSVDSWEEFEFIRGSEAKIIRGNPLNIIIPKRINK